MHTLLVLMHLSHFFPLLLEARGKAMVPEVSVKDARHLPKGYLVGGAQKSS